MMTIVQRLCFCGLVTLAAVVSLGCGDSEQPVVTVNNAPASQPSQPIP